MPRWLTELQPLWKTLKNLAKGHEKLSEVDESSPHHPYKACIILRQAGIPCKIWGNDTQPFPGIPTDTSDLCILVPDPEKASQVLREHAYIPTTPDPAFEKIPEFKNAPRFVSPVPLGLPAMGAVRDHLGEWKLTTFHGLVFFDVLLLPAADWGYSLEGKMNGLRQLIPRLHEHFDCIVAKWLDVSPDQARLRRYLGTIIASEFDKAEEFRTRYFKSQVRKEHRQLLFDILADVVDVRDLVRRNTQWHYQDIRDRTLQGHHKPVRPDNVVTRSDRVEASAGYAQLQESDSAECVALLRN